MTLIKHPGRRVKGRAPGSLPSGQPPAQDIGDALERASAEGSAFPLAGPPRPSFTPHGTAPAPSYPARHAAGPPDLPPLPPSGEMPAPGPDSGTVLYSGPGWAWSLCAARVRNGEWADLAALVEDGRGRNAAEMNRAFRHNHERVGEGWRQLCITLGRTDQIVPGWRKIRDIAAGLAAEAAAQGSGPQPRAEAGAR